MQKIKIWLLIILLAFVAGMTIKQHYSIPKSDTLKLGALHTMPELWKEAPTLLHGTSADERDEKNIPVWIFRLPEEERARRCLALNIYYEARDEPEEGMSMVGYVTEKRREENRPYWGSTTCEVVFKKRAYRKKRGKKWLKVEMCEFSWACMKGVEPNPQNFLKWAQALRLARKQLEGEYTPPRELVGALYYLRPGHSSRSGRVFFKRLVFLGKVGHHHFYGERP